MRGTDPGDTLEMDLAAARTSILESVLYMGEFDPDSVYRAPMIVSTGTGRLFMFTDATGAGSGQNPIDAPQYWHEIGRPSACNPIPRASLAGTAAVRSSTCQETFTSTRSSQELMG